MADAQGQQGWIAAKLTPQRTPQDLIVRPALLQELVPGDVRPRVTLVTAPAGYGKSTLMLQAMNRLQERGELVCWLSLDQGDNSPQRLSAYILRSYNEAANRLEQAAALPAYPNANHNERMVALFSAVVELDLPTTLILDDFHQLSGDSVLEFIDWLARSMPPTMSLLLGSRAATDMALVPEFKAKLHLVEIGPNRLRFSLAECLDYFAKHPGLALSRESVELLHTKTEGWIAALQLTLLTLQEQEDPDAFVAEFSGSDRDIVRYLGASAWSQLDQVTRDFMLRTSLLERMNGELCELLTEDTGAVEILSQLERSGLFVFALDRNNRWYRYHHLIRQHLLEELIQSAPQLYPELCSRAARWFENNGQVNEAIAYYLQAQYFDAAALLISRNASRLVQYQGQHEQLFDWLQALPVEHIYPYPETFVCYLWSLTFTRRLQEIDPLIGDFWRHVPTQSGDLSGSNAVGGDRDYLHYSLEMIAALRDVLSGDNRSAQAGCTAWLDKWSSAPQFERGTVLAALGTASIGSHEYVLARKVLREARDEFHACDAGYGIAWTNSIFALVCLRQGNLSEAKQVIEDALEAASEAMGEHSYSCATLSLVLAQVHYERNELEAAQRLLDKGYLYIEEHGLPDTTVAGYITRAKLLARTGDMERALAVLRTGERFGRDRHMGNIVPMLALERSQFLVQSGQIPAARDIAEEFGFDTLQQISGGVASFEDMLSGVFAARLLAEEGEITEALQSLNGLLRLCKKKGCKLLLVRMLILKSHLLASQQQLPKAMRTLQEAIDLAAPESILSIFVEESPLAKPIVMQLIAAQSVNPGFARQGPVRDFMLNLCLALGIDSGSYTTQQSDGSDRSSSLDKLTRRERQILSLLNEGLSNQQLADSLCVSLNTLKWHLANIYGKLGVRNKVQAIKAVSATGMQ